MAICVTRHNLSARDPVGPRSPHKRQAAQKLKADKAWKGNGRVFCSPVGMPLDAANGRRAFRLITGKAEIGEDWTPREMRHSFVSIMSDQEVPTENIADLCGHSSTAVTEEVYRQQLKPVITKGAETINTVFGGAKPKPAEEKIQKSA